jgi:fumarylpyruvate hydrolase
MDYIIAQPDVNYLSVAGQSSCFPVNRVFCVGRNYEDHAREMGGDVEREPPFFFMKPANAVVPMENGKADVPYPPMTSDYQHEIEMVVAIGSVAYEIEKDKAREHITGYAVGLDMTRRDLQMQARNMGRPWDLGKSFFMSAPIGDLYLASDIGHPDDAEISVEVNGETRQSSNINMLIWSVEETIAYLSKFEPLLPGDIIMTGTPKGVRPVNVGDVMVGRIVGLGSITVSVIERNLSEYIR